ncbi:hypothetical protein [Agathobaculum sp.]|uniref:hypothetical protein n=1 Tax=Agathobaculum sp. TaxID=2048138 RepID=UPI0027B9B08E|nr:hypothetical protein [Agathobaculum sp.]
MNIHEWIIGGGGLLAVLLTLVQIAPVKINPWSAIAKAIGNAINADVLRELDTVTQKLDTHIRVDDERNADSYRTRILQFNNELLREIQHTREDFIEILAVIDDYESYCRDHKEYKNNRAVCAIENIKRVYMERLQKHDFL